MADFTSAFYAVPPVTRTLLLATAAVTGPCLLGIVSPYHVALVWPRLASFEIWRPVTTFFFGGSGFPLLYDFFLIYRNSSSLEKDVYFGDTADYAWTHVMLALFIHVLNIPFGQPFLFRPLLHAQNYTWCRANPTIKISIFGLLTLPTSLYPFALIVLDVLTGGPGKAMGGIIGLLSGHLWWFISVYLPRHAATRHRRPNPLRTPLYFRSFFPSRGRSSTAGGWGNQRSSASTTGFTATVPRGTDDAVEAARHRWGSGNKLGGESL